MEDSFHREILEAHSDSPFFQGSLVDFNHSGMWTSEKTGNKSKVELLIKNSQILQISFRVQGSALSLACSSLMCAQIKGMCLSESRKLGERVIIYVEKGIDFSLPGDLIVYQTISRFPDRHDCSLLSWRALMNALPMP